MENINSRLLRNQAEESSAARELREKRRSSSAEATEDKGEEDEGAGAEGEPRSLRQRVQAARQAMDLKAKAKQKLEEKVTAPVGMLKSKFLNLIPGYGPYVAFKRFIAGRKSKFNIVDIIIMLFSNLNACFIVLAVLAFIALIVTWATDPLSAVKAIMDLGWDGVKALVKLFLGKLSVK